MKKLTLLIIFFVTYLFTNAQAPVNGLIGYYPLNNNAKDYSGKGYNGTLVNGALSDTGCSICRPDSGLYCDQNGADCGNPADHDFDLQGDATISMWVQFRGSLSQVYLMGKDEGGGSNNKWIVLYNYSFTGGAPGPSNTLVFPLNFTGGSSLWVYSGTFIPKLNVCYHIAITKQQNLVTGVGTYSFYVNSVNIGTTGSNTLSKNIPLINADMSVGSLSPGFEGCNVDALIDRVRIYNRCLGQSGIDSLYNETAPKIAMVPTADTTICPGSKLNLSASGGSNYTWNNGVTSSSLIEQPVVDTMYKVTNISPGTNCVSKDSAAITVYTLTVTPTSSSVCAGTAVPLAANGTAGGTYTWKPAYALSTATGATTTGTPTTSTTYTVVESATGCTDSTNATITVTPQIVPGITAPQTICTDKSVSLSASGGTAYTWLPATGLSSTVISDPIANPTNTTTYTVTITDGICTIKDSVEVTVSPTPTNNICCSATITVGQNTSVGVTFVNTGNTYDWSPAAALSCDTCASPVASPTVTTWYYAIISNANGCSIKDSVLITVKENCGPIYVPTAFSPNGDGHNDGFKVMGNCIQNISLVIFDRWGNKVYETTDPNAIWDGTYKGQSLNTGTYVYALQITDAQNNTINKKGNITLVR